MGETSMQARYAAATVRLVIVMGVAALVTQGCGLIPGGSTRPPERTIEVAGVVVSRTVGVEGSRGYEDFTLADGRTQRIYSDAAGLAPNVGDLLIAGTTPYPWLGLAIPHGPPGWPEGCYEPLPQNGVETETTIELDDGLTVMKAPDFTWPGRPAHGNRLLNASLCLDTQGRVFEVITGGYR
jgi:hypothetical protein